MSRRGLVAVALVGLLGLALPRVAAPGRADTVDPSLAGLHLVLSAVDRWLPGPNHGYQQIFTADSGGANLKQVTAYDGNYYDWATWAMNGTKLVFTAKNRLPVPPHDNVGEERVYLSDPDGSNRMPLTDNPWRNLQPKITSDGRSMIFGSYWNEFPVLGLYRMDLATRQVTSISMNSTDGGLDADPRVSADGKRIVFASAWSPQGAIPTQVFLMNLDGTDRVPVSHDAWFDTDPSISPDGRYVAWSSYRGDQRPELEGANKGFQFPMRDWHIVVKDLQTGAEHEVTAGRSCADQAPGPQACTPTQASAWVPHWSPDGKRLGFIAALSSAEIGVYAVRPDGSDPVSVISSPTLSITYWDWAATGTAPAGAVKAIGSHVPPSQLLLSTLSTQDTSAPSQLLVTSPDRWTAAPITLGAFDPHPQQARWSADKRRIIFTASVDFDRASVVYGPSPPRGQVRHPHYTLDMLQRGFVPLYEDTTAAREQVFLMNADGTGVRQLTYPGTEDYMDAQVDGDLRGHTDPDLSPDGRYAIATSYSTLTHESFIIRIDLATGAVLNLTSVNAGAVPVADGMARYSPDGSRIAFQSVIGGNAQLFVMNADGTNVRQLTDDGQFNVQPAWSPDGGWLVFASYRKNDLPINSAADVASGLTSLVSTDNWVLAKVPTGGGDVVTLTDRKDSPAFSPVFSPDGSQVAYVSAGSSKQADIYVVDADGRNRHRLNETLLTREESIDWR